MDRVLRRSGLGMVAIAALQLGTPGCTKDNPRYCDESTACADEVLSYCDLHGDYGDVGRRCIEPPQDAGAPECQHSSECTSLTRPICDPIRQVCDPCDHEGSGDTDCAAVSAATPLCRSDGACVECRGEDDCSGSTPVCDDATGLCRPCTTATDCNSEVCDKSSGECVPEWDIVYVDRSEGSDGAECGGPTSPCATISGADGALAKTTVARNSVKLRAGVYDELVTISGGQTITLVGPSTISAPSLSDSPAVLVQGGSTVTIDELTLSNGSGGSGADGVRCTSSSWLNLVDTTISGHQGTGVEIDACTANIEVSTISSNDDGGVSISDGALTITRSTITGNPGGGVAIAASAFTVRNNFITSNGTAGAAGSLIGGISFDNPGTILTQILEFNTIADNKSHSTSPAAGVYCEVVTALTASNNIVYPVVGGADAVAGNCTWTYSDIEGGHDGTGNIDEEPDFVSATGGNFHLENTSPCKDTGDPAATVVVDIDGDVRPQGERADMGADEVAE